MRIFNKYNLIVASIFVLAFVLIMLNRLSVYLNLAALVLFVVAFAMLSVPLFINAKNRRLDIQGAREELIMELSSDGEAYLLEETKKPKKFKAFKDKISIYIPGVLCVLMALLFLLATITSIIKLIR